MNLGPERPGQPTACDGCGEPLPASGGPQKPRAGFYGHGGAHLVIWQPKKKTAQADICPTCARAVIALLRRYKRERAAQVVAPESHGGRP